MNDSHAVAASRAKQFIPFAALRGFYEMVEDVSREYLPKKELLSDRLEELNAAFELLEVGDIIAVQHYENGAYAEEVGPVQQVDAARRALKVAGRWLSAQDISELELVKAHG